MSPKDIVIELLWNLVVDEEIDDNESMLLWCFLDEIIRILTDDLGTSIRVEREFLSRDLDDDRIDINRPNSIGEVKFVSEERYHRASTESEQEYILWRRKSDLTDSKSHNPME